MIHESAQAKSEAPKAKKRAPGKKKEEKRQTVCQSASESESRDKQSSRSPSVSRIVNRLHPLPSFAAPLEAGPGHLSFDASAVEGNAPLSRRFPVCGETTNFSFRYNAPKEMTEKRKRRQRAARVEGRRRRESVSTMTMMPFQRVLLAINSNDARMGDDERTSLTTPLVEAVFLKDDDTLCTGKNSVKMSRNWLGGWERQAVLDTRQDLPGC